MLKILIYTDGSPAAAAALRFGAILAERLGTEIVVITVCPGSCLIDEPPLLGEDIPQVEWNCLPTEIHILTHAMGLLTELGFLVSQPSINILEVESGYLFFASAPSGGQVPFYVRYGDLIEVLNHEMAGDWRSLVVIALPRIGPLKRFVGGDIGRRLVLNLNSSVLVVRGGDIDSRFLICVDGSPSAYRGLPILKQLLPAVRTPVDLIWVQVPWASEEEVRAGDECVRQARTWLDSCAKPGGLFELAGPSPLDMILQEARDQSVIVMGASLRHDLSRRLRGSLPLEVSAWTDSSVLVVKFPPAVDTDFFKEVIS
ncbi:MAG: universal stress protein [Deltaproteobacteria bacterium]|nr:MAG: universal stress protein [Deltaproteobacteria bacterium]